MKRLAVAWLLLVGCTFDYEGYRVWVGPDRDIDWIDVRTTYKSVSPEWIVDFEDTSDIQEVVRTETDLGCGFLIKKARSTWYLWSPSGAVVDYTLRLMWTDEDQRRLDG